MVNESDVGAGYEADQKYVNNVTYKEGTTPESIAAWIAAKRPEGTADDAAGSADGGGSEKAPAFGNKRFGGNKEKDAA